MVVAGLGVVAAGTVVVAGTGGTDEMTGGGDPAADPGHVTGTVAGDPAAAATHAAEAGVIHAAEVAALRRIPAKAPGTTRTKTLHQGGQAPEISKLGAGFTLTSYESTTTVQCIHHATLVVYIIWEMDC